MLKANFLGNLPKSGSFACKTGDFPNVRLLRHEAYVKLADVVDFVTGPLASYHVSFTDCIKSTASPTICHLALTGAAVCTQVERINYNVRYAAPLLTP
jgi:hypothetical protein